MTATLKTIAPVDLHTLPKPTVIEPLSFEAIVAQMKHDFLKRLQENNETNPSDENTEKITEDLVESDPAMKLLEAAAWRELLLRQRINEAARANLLAFATGSDLDHLAAFYGVVRQFSKLQDDNQSESDESLRNRLQAKIVGFSMGGSREAYRYQALSADARVRDACCTSPESGTVRIAILASDNDGLADVDLLKAVTARIKDPAIRLLTDSVEVVSCTPIVTPIRAIVTFEADALAEKIIAQSREQCRQQLAAHQRLGWSLTRSWLIAALFIEGMEKIDLREPVKDITVPEDGMVIVSDIELRDSALGVFV